MAGFLLLFLFEHTNGVKMHIGCFLFFFQLKCGNSFPFVFLQRYGKKKSDASSSGLMRD